MGGGGGAHAAVAGVVYWTWGGKLAVVSGASISPVAGGRFVVVGGWV